MNDSRRTDDTAPLGWAVTQTMPYAAPPAPEAASPPGAEAPAPFATRGSEDTEALNPPRWSGRRTAIAAALAIGVSSIGAVGAAAAVPAGASSGETGGQFQRGFGPGGQGGFGGQLPSQSQNQQGGVPNGPGGQLPGGQLPGGQPPAPADPNASTT